MSFRMNRRTLLKESLAATAAGALAWHAAAEEVSAADAPQSPLPATLPPPRPTPCPPARSAS